MMPNSFRSVLILSPHTDDAELGCGGSIARWLEEKRSVHVAVFSSADESLPKGAKPGTLRREFEKSMRCYGITPSHSTVYDFAVRKLSYHRQEILEKIVDLKRTVKPDLVLLPSGNDLHQDHQVIHIEGLRAFKESSVFGYELPWNHINFSAQAFVQLTQRHLALKWRSLQEYKTQLQLQRAYFTKEFILGLAAIRGTQIKSKYAESFEVLRIKI